MSQVSETSVKALLRQHWAIETTSLQVLKGGMNSASWEIRAGGSRWVLKAVQADYFARRLFDRDMTGIETMVENEKGLADAQRALGDF